MTILSLAFFVLAATAGIFIGTLRLGTPRAAERATLSHG